MQVLSASLIHPRRVQFFKPLSFVFLFVVPDLRQSPQRFLPRASDRPLRYPRFPLRSGGGPLGMDNDSCVCEASDSGWTNPRFDGKPVAARSRVRFDAGTPLPCSRRSSNKTRRLGVRSGRRSSQASSAEQETQVERLSLSGIIIKQRQRGRQPTFITSSTTTSSSNSASISTQRSPTSISVHNFGSRPHHRR
ncbi:hypothetical protein BDY24DRAFT_7934 [Mrakia frigida]|uniref:uncharacterized protein n=1 Tax=Mrakia frigida TaxID=29902 RepID=UPI003FCBF405